MEKTHFFKLDNVYTPKNNLDNAIRVHLKSLDGTLIPPGQKENFKKQLADKVDELHAQHPRCKKIILDIWSFDGSPEALTCGCSNGDFFDVNHEFKPHSDEKK